MTPPEIVLHFYTSFAEGDAKSMAACYHPDIAFSDPAFGTLKGDEASNMWEMLLSQSKKPIKISFKNIQQRVESVSAEWTAEYNFSPTGRKVFNQISAQFEFQDGLIIRHTDHFNLWKWSQQALGFQGFLIGWTPFFKRGLQKKTHKMLSGFMERHQIQ